MNLTRDFQTELEYSALIFAARDNYHVGVLGEELFTKLVHPRWKAVRLGAGCGSDVRITDTITGETFCVEVKTARLRFNSTYKRSGWQFNIFKPQKTDFKKSDFVALLAISETAGLNAFYLIPSSDLDIKKIQLWQASVSKYEAYKVSERFIFPC